MPQAIPALRKGYDILMEKPISPDLAQCKEILAVARETGRKVVVCHVLRYAPFYRKIKEVLDSGVLGELMSIQAIENVGYWHRPQLCPGELAQQGGDLPHVPAKMLPRHGSYGLAHRKELCPTVLLRLPGSFPTGKRPAGAAKRCLDGCQAKDRCPYDAEKIYITSEKTGVAQGKTGLAL